MATMDNILTTGGSLVGGLINAGANIYMQNQTNRNNRAIANENNRFNREMWNLQTQYNTPANQMQRFKEAGLNTSLMYGTPQNVASSPTPADTTGKAVAPQIQMDSVIANSMQQYKQNQLIDAQAKDLQASARSKEINNIQEEKKLPYSEKNALLDNQTRTQQLELLNQNIEVAKNQINVIREDRQRLYQANEMMRDTWNYIEKTAEEKYKLSQEEVKIAMAQSALLTKELLQMDERFDLFKGLTEHQIEKARLENKLLGVDANNIETLYGGDNAKFGLIRQIIKDLVSAYAQAK